MEKRYSLNMTSGPFLKKILVFSVPLMLTGLLQLAYNTADVIVVGRFAGKEALAAVGSTGSLINLLLNVFLGLLLFIRYTRNLYRHLRHFRSHKSHF